MPVCADTKVVVQAVDDTYEKLHAAFANQKDAAVGNDGAVRLEF